jgi:hypothetical protein
MHIYNLFKQKKDLPIGPNSVGPFEDRSQAGAIRSRNGRGIAAPCLAGGLTTDMSQPRVHGL